MKTTPLLLCSILFSIHFTSTLSTRESNDPILDVDGHHLVAGTKYYILPELRGNGGGLTLGAAAGNKKCPHDVVQHRREAENGIPVTFHPINPKKGVVRELSDHNIIFSTASVCGVSTVWTLSYNESFLTDFITTGGVEGNPGSDTVRNWFNVEKVDGGYKLRFCPGLLNYFVITCKDVGVYVDGGVRRLILVGGVLVDADFTDAPPLKVVFKKA